jgi:flavin-dependent dehydrogenase
MHRRVDAAVIGGGPAGSVAAITLAEAGLTTVVVNASHQHATFRIGEVLPPEVTPVLIDLGVWKEFANLSPLPSPGRTFVWGSNKLRENDFIFGLCGNGWHIDRAHFDQMLLNAAQRAGAELIASTRALRCHYDTFSDEWIIESRSGERPFPLKTKYLVSATGRSSPPSGAFPCSRTYYDRMIAITGILTSRSGNYDDQRLLVEAVEEGWWYSAPIPINRLVIAYLTDGDLLGPSPCDKPERWCSLLRRAPNTVERTHGYSLSSKIQIFSASSYFRGPVAGHMSLAVGDAAAACDPLSGQGILTSIIAGRSAAHAIASARNSRSDTAVRAYGESQQEVYARYLGERMVLYRLEGRWPESPFWARRHVVAQPLR